MEVSELDLLFFLRNGRAKMFNQKFTPLEKQGHIYKMSSVLTNKGEQQVFFQIFKRFTFLYSQKIITSKSKYTFQFNKSLCLI